MTCEEALVLLSGHLDGENTEEEAAQLQAHLAECEDCRRLLENLQALDREILSLEVEPPADLCANVMEAIRKEAPRRKKRRWVWPTAAAAAVLVLLIGAGAWAAPNIQAKKNTVPYAARMAAEAQEPAAAMTAEAAAPEPSAALARETDDVSLDDEAGTPMLFAASVSNDSQAQTLADERGAAVVLLYTNVPELDGLPYETLEDGSLLYTLDQAGDAQALYEAYPDEAVLFLPETEAAGVSFALRLP